ncbi:RidA family protein [Leifsonia sp. 2TAF2]|uniref:RidA family protein n=1 Tax=Leifsonia sp. 2TAF2 TaxID=3233009 RepID=UPI003F97653F
MPHREAIFPEDNLALNEKHGYSPAIRSGDLLFVSGQVGSLRDGTPEPDYESQVRLAYENLEATLAAGGCTFDDIVDVTVFHTVPLNQTAEEAGVQAGIRSRVRREKFPHAPFTNMTAVGVSWLAGFDFEIKVIARVPSM